MPQDGTTARCSDLQHPRCSRSGSVRAAPSHEGRASTVIGQNALFVKRLLLALHLASSRKRWLKVHVVFTGEGEGPYFIVEKSALVITIWERKLDCGPYFYIGYTPFIKMSNILTMQTLLTVEQHKTCLPARRIVCI